MAKLFDRENLRNIRQIENEQLLETQRVLDDVANVFSVLDLVIQSMLLYSSGLVSKNDLFPVRVAYAKEQNNIIETLTAFFDQSVIYHMLTVKDPEVDSVGLERRENILGKNFAINSSSLSKEALQDLLLGYDEVDSEHEEATLKSIYGSDLEDDKKSADKPAPHHLEFLTLEQESVYFFLLHFILKNLYALKRVSYQRIQYESVLIAKNETFFTAESDWFVNTDPESTYNRIKFLQRILLDIAEKPFTAIEKHQTKVLKVGHFTAMAKKVIKPMPSEGNIPLLR